eukprot:469616-Prymnesium_polylepis.1
MASQEAPGRQNTVSKLHPHLRCQRPARPRVQRTCAARPAVAQDPGQIAQRTHRAPCIADV